MTAIAPTAATPMPPRPVPGRDGLPPATVDGGGSQGLRIRMTNWMEARLGKAAMPVAALAGGVLGGTLGMLALGPIGAAVGGVGGAFFGAAVFMAR